MPAHITEYVQLLLGAGRTCKELEGHNHFRWHNFGRSFASAPFPPMCNRHGPCPMVSSSGCREGVTPVNNVVPHEQVCG